MRGTCLVCMSSVITLTVYRKTPQPPQQNNNRAALKTSDKFIDVSHTNDHLTH